MLMDITPTILPVLPRTVREREKMPGLFNVTSTQKIAHLPALLTDMQKFVGVKK